MERLDKWNTETVAHSRSIYDVQFILDEEEYVNHALDSS